MDKTIVESGGAVDLDFVRRQQPTTVNRRPAPDLRRPSAPDLRRPSAPPSR
jgi:hypothetical protein